ncbi:MAG: tRNA (uridine(34)/cytosine(34)/5-carboxymethylaminomethyluridine(34)-2'-O)-methyltransferase TrmL [Cyanobacteria bacterium P01_A01_bin.114]
MPHIVLVNPEIPPNTGNIARTCAATAVELHLVAPLGFELSDRYLKRAGLDYWPYVKLHLHDSIDIFWQHQQERGGRLLGYTTSGTSNYLEIKYKSTDWLLFGCETKGLPSDILARCQYTVRIPIVESSVRSLNLSVSVAVGLFEAVRQLS